MANRYNSKLTDEVHAVLVKAFAEGLPNVSACRRAGIHRHTLTNWLKRGEAAKSGKYRELYKDVSEARSTWWEAKQSELEQVVYRQATQREKTINIKMYRVLKLSAEDEIFLQEAIEESDALKERFAEDGVLYKQEITIKEHLPNGRLGLEILARKVPEEWGKYETLKLEFDLNKELKELGLDANAAEVMIAGAVAALDEMIQEKGQDPSAVNGHPTDA